jgi:hypothetical protein
MHGRGLQRSRRGSDRRFCPAPLRFEQKGVRIDTRARRQKNRQKPLRIDKGRNSMTNCYSHSKPAVFFDLKGAVTMKYSKRSFTVVPVLIAVLLPLSTGALNARDADPAALTFAAAQTAKQQCVNTCRVRYRDCRSLKQIPSFECRGIYQDCTRNTCNASPAGRPSWPGFPT